MAKGPKRCKDAAVLVLTRAETESLLDLDGLRNAVAAAMVDVSAGGASMPSRIAARIETRDGLLLAMPAYLPGSEGLAAKLVSLFPQNAGSAWPTHQAVVIVFDATTGAPAALIDGTSITAARTAAGSALSTDLLARPDAHVLAILGTGVQARAHAHAVTRVRSFDEIRIWGRDAAGARRLAAELSEELHHPLTAVDDNLQACTGADVICATTHSPDPVVSRAAVVPGTHVTSVGYNTAGRELDSRTVADALLVVESRAAVLAPPPSGSTDIRIPIEEGLITEHHIHAEIGEIVARDRPGRTSDDQLTLYKSVGIAAQDVAGAALVLRAARDRGVGTEVAL
jgi:ornithine cyclodeaminase